MSQVTPRLESVLLSFPTELLVEVVKNLTCLDILHARVTCKRLYEVTKSLLVWRHVVAQEPRQRLWLERPINTYTSEELEGLALRRLSVEFGYDNLIKGAQPHQRTISVSYDIGRTKLVPGGRWLLVTTLRGGIFYYDLDCEDVGPNVLIPEGSTQCIMRIAIDVDVSSPYLKFNLAFWVSRYCPPINNANPCLNVWEIRLLLDDTGRGIGLEGNCRAKFSGGFHGPYSNIVLCGKYIAHGVDRPLTERILGFSPWTMDHEYDRSYYCRQIPGFGGHGLALLPNGQLFFLAESHAVLYPRVSTASGEPLKL
ncbi:hypothetical protein BDN72DRAFT_583507 [Pluteus cervinus]|uniref:Uncharacterized protein n=1 Tax=Pluteus cervinus TaxID=181527 RepID=A0ACD3AVL4_9AGAR|nr:hypothetical protein BDN72DRAFT_583507 [Pluteus cervinus]